mmetsp:Transcript_38057/g.74552  ORF Transcript_38057/g.74552 Transcript_38057/m.74552 type:complete len:355 (-) Transcript_38057:88-1152(-)
MARLIVPQRRHGFFAVAFPKISSVPGLGRPLPLLLLAAHPVFQAVDLLRELRHERLQPRIRRRCCRLRPRCPPFPRPFVGILRLFRLRAEGGERKDEPQVGAPGARTRGFVEVIFERVGRRRGRGGGLPGRVRNGSGTAAVAGRGAVRPGVADGRHRGGGRRGRHPLQHPAVLEVRRRTRSAGPPLVTPVGVPRGVRGRRRGPRGRHDRLPHGTPGTEAPDPLRTRRQSQRREAGDVVPLPLVRLDPLPLRRHDGHLPGARGPQVSDLRRECRELARLGFGGLGEGGRLEDRRGFGLAPGADLPFQLLFDAPVIGQGADDILRLRAFEFARLQFVVGRGHVRIFRRARSYHGHH